MLTRWVPSPLRLVCLVGGQWLFGTGEAMIVAAHLGNSPWTVFAQGTAVRTGLSIGSMTNLIGALVLLLWIPLRQRPGLGTVANVLLVGTALDLALHWLPDLTALPWRIALCIGGILVVALGSGIYLTTGLGPGPRDGLMTGIARVSGGHWGGTSRRRGDRPDRRLAAGRRRGDRHPAVRGLHRTLRPPRGAAGGAHPGRRTLTSGTAAALGHLVRHAAATSAALLQGGFALHSHVRVGGRTTLDRSGFAVR